MYYIIFFKKRVCMIKTKVSVHTSQVHQAVVVALNMILQYTIYYLLSTYKCIIDNIIFIMHAFIILLILYVKYNWLEQIRYARLVYIVTLYVPLRSKITIYPRPSFKNGLQYIYRERERERLMHTHDRLQVLLNTRAHILYLHNNI